MGYDLHVTRRKSWSDEGHDITADEWLAYVRSDPELTLDANNGPHFAMWRGEDEWLDWSDGQIYAKNPSEALVEKMVAIARHFNGSVQGDDGEIYQGGGAAPEQPKPSLWARVAAGVRGVLAERSVDVDHSAFDLRQGDRVADLWGQTGVVVGIDPRAERGTGTLRVRYEDGREVEFSMIGHPFRKLDT